MSSSPRLAPRTWALTFALISALGAVLLCAARTRAEPLVRVRGESRIELGVTQVEVGVSVTGALRDELGGALAGRRLALEAVPLTDPVEPWRTQLTTDGDGRFSLEIGDPVHDYRLLATFAGDDTHRGVRVERRVERARSDVRLELRLPLGHTIDLDAPELVVEAVAESDVGGGNVSMRLWDEAGRELGSGVTDRGGHLRVRIPTSRLGTAGAGLVRIESLRDQRRAEAQTEARVVRRRSVFLKLHAAALALEAGQPAALRGRVFTRVAPRALVPVGLFAGDRHLATVMTDARGAFQTDLWIDRERGSVEITARVEGDATGAYPAAEARVQLRVSPARPVPLLWLLAAALVIGAVAWLCTRRRARAALDGELRPHVREPTEPSISPARAQGRRDRHHVSGRVIDLRGEWPVPNARVEVTHGQGAASCQLQTDDSGRFESAALPHGRARLRVEAAGYVSTEIELELPHRGEWSAVVIRLESLRARALAAFRTLALSGALPSPRAWGVWTAREVREWLAERAPSQRSAIRKLTSEVERACYAREVPDPALIADIEQTALSVATELSAQRTPPARERRRAR